MTVKKHRLSGTHLVFDPVSGHLAYCVTSPCDDANGCDTTICWQADVSLESVEDCNREYLAGNCLYGITLPWALDPKTFAWHSACRWETAEGDRFSPDGSVSPEIVWAWEDSSHRTCALVISNLVMINFGEPWSFDCNEGGIYYGHGLLPHFVDPDWIEWPAFFHVAFSKVTCP